MVKDAFLKGCDMTMNTQELIKKITEALEDADGEFVAEIYQTASKCSIHRFPDGEVVNLATGNLGGGERTLAA